MIPFQKNNNRVQAYQDRLYELLLARDFNLEDWRGFTTEYRDLLGQDFRESRPEQPDFFALWNNLRNDLNLY